MADEYTGNASGKYMRTRRCPGSDKRYGHEVLQMMLASGECWTAASLEAAIHRRFGAEARFHTCSAENLSAAELVAFLEQKGKFIARATGFTTAENKICQH